MIVAIILVLVGVGSVLFHVLSPWWWTPIASNWSYIDNTIVITFWITGVKADTVRPRMATPKAVTTSARWAMRYGHSRRIQPRDIRREYGRSSGYWRTNPSTGSSRKV